MSTIGKQSGLTRAVDKLVEWGKKHTGSKATKAQHNASQSDQLESPRQQQYRADGNVHWQLPTPRPTVINVSAQQAVVSSAKTQATEYTNQAIREAAQDLCHSFFYATGSQQSIDVAKQTLRDQAASIAKERQVDLGVQPWWTGNMLAEALEHGLKAEPPCGSNPVAVTSHAFLQRAFARALFAALIEGTRSVASSKREREWVKTYALQGAEKSGNPALVRQIIESACS